MPVSKLYRRFLRYPLWRACNPTAPYEQFYAHIVTQRLVRRIGHSAIGGSARPIRRSTELLDVVLKHGMRPDQRFIDYGCGSLRLGKAVVEYLEPGNFCGLDIAQEFLDLAGQFVGPELMRQKQPSLAVIDEDSLKRAREFEPDFIGSWHVCSKIPDRHLRRYLMNIIGLMSKRTHTFIQFPQTDRRSRLNQLNWALPHAQFTNIVRTISQEVNVDFVELIPRNQAGVTETYAHLYFNQCS